jgi:predicted nucleic acid-binding protein
LGLILDTGILIASERRGDGVEDVLRYILKAKGEIDVAISAVSVVELTHGIYRAKSEIDRERRRTFTESVFQGLVVQSVTLEIAQLAGQIEGEQASIGNSIPFEDLLIGATAISLGYEVASLNVRHFARIPGLQLAGIPGLSS